MDPLEWYLRTTGLEMWTYTASGVALTCRPGDREMHCILAAYVRARARRRAHGFT